MINVKKSAQTKEYSLVLNLFLITKYGFLYINFKILKKGDAN